MRQAKIKEDQPNSGDSLRGRNVLIVGKNSYVGEFLCDHFAAQGARLSAVGSSDCNFLEAGQVGNFSRACPRSRSRFCSWRW